MWILLMRKLAPGHLLIKSHTLFIQRPQSMCYDYKVSHFIERGYTANFSRSKVLFQDLELSCKEERFMIWAQKWICVWGYTSCLYSVIVHLRVVLKRAVVGDWHFNNLSGSHLQSQVNSVCQALMLQVWSIETDWSVEPGCYWLKDLCRGCHKS